MFDKKLYTFLTDSQKFIYDSGSIEKKPLCYVQLLTFAYIRLLDRPKENEVILREQIIEQNIFFKMLPAS